MYLAYYNLIEKPFQITTDPRFLWLGEKHQEALATLNYGLLDDKGFLLLTGDVGTGKTTLIKALIQNLGEDTIFATVVSPLADKMEFFHYLGDILGMPGSFTTKVEFLTRFTQFLTKAHHANKTVLLIIDEAQSLTREILEEIRLLSNIEKDSKKLLNIFFVGQNEFNDLLMEHDCRALRQRITITYNLSPLTEKETRAYVKHRLKVAGTAKELFNAKAIREIHKFSRGYPRLINIMCDHALLTGYVREKKTITIAMIRECARELSLPGERSPGVPRQYVQVKTKNGGRFRKAFMYAGLTAVAMVVAFGLYAWAGNEFPSLSARVHSWWEQVLAPAPKPIAGNLQKPDPQTTVSPASSQIKNDIVNADPAQEKAQDQDETRQYKGHDSGQEKMSDFPEGSVVAVFGEGETGAGDLKITEPAEIPRDDMDGEGMSMGTAEKADNQYPETEDSEKRKDGLVVYDGYKMTVPFEYDTNSLSSKAFENLERLSKALEGNEDYKIIVRGYTDGLGNRQYNLKLSEFRANIVTGYLVGKGVNPSHIESMALADDNPVSPNDSSVGRAANRRVEIELRAVTED